MDFGALLLLLLGQLPRTPLTLDTATASAVAVVVVLIERERESKEKEEKKEGKERHCLRQCCMCPLLKCELLLLLLQPPPLPNPFAPASSPLQNRFSLLVLTRLLRLHRSTCTRLIRTDSSLARRLSTRRAGLL